MFCSILSVFLSGLVRFSVFLAWVCVGLSVLSVLEWFLSGFVLSVFVVFLSVF